MTTSTTYRHARERATTKYRFYVHAGTFAAVMLLLIVINLITSPGVWWFIWPLIGWGFAVALHGLQAFVFADRTTVIDRLTEEELRRTGKSEAEGERV